ncbi:dehydrogenase/reductase SDR family member 4-like [Leptinotarsa decemlineata]|uniref:dehydrogenase/reductase SDR family member 4-like n=1 Tax=Leptinotarsa decemlineata TaxID=7539 RepID=UPI003D30A425
MTSTLWRAPSTLDTSVSKSKTVKTKKQPPTASQIPSTALNIEPTTTTTSLETTTGPHNLPKAGSIVPPPPMPVPTVHGATSGLPSGSEVELLQLSRRRVRTRQNRSREEDKEMLSKILWTVFILMHTYCMQPISARLMEKIECAMESKRLKGKIGIVTGSTYGIGYAIAEKLAIEGATVIVCSRQKKHVDEAVSKLREKNYNAFGVVCHVSNADDRKHLFETAEKLGGLDILVQNVGVNPAPLTKVFDCADEAWDKIFNINVNTSFLLSKEALPLLQRSKAGRIVYMSSLAAFHYYARMGAYGVSKVALVGLTKYGSLHLAEFNITVNCVAPGLIDTRFVKNIKEDPEFQFLLENTKVIPLGRTGDPRDVAGTVAFLASDDASYITGETIVVGGGAMSRL